jgi:hypothetical protein
MERKIAQKKYNRTKAKMEQKEKPNIIDHPEDYIEKNKAIAYKIYNEMHDIDKELKPETRLEMLQNNYMEFTKEFPIVMRYIGQMGMYHPKSFELYLKKLQTGLVKDEVDLIDANVKYCGDLYYRWHKSKGIHISPTDKSSYMTKIRKELEDERKEFHDKFEELSKKYDENEKDYDKEKASNIRETIIRMKKEYEKNKDECETFTQYMNQFFTYFDTERVELLKQQQLQKPIIERRLAEIEQDFDNDVEDYDLSDFPNPSEEGLTLRDDIS